jgi:predicted dehydrogenase
VGITVAVVGVGAFGVAFVPIYARHPDVDAVIVCEPDPARRERVASAFGLERTAPDLHTLLASHDVDAVHLVTPMELHADQAILALDAGVHCACAVPMGLTVDELRNVVAAEQRSGRNFMMMESALYTRAFLHAHRLVDEGALGRIQFLRAAHYSDYEFWPSWKWYPPMLYATHAVAPLLALAETRTTSVRCLGSGRIPSELGGPMDNPFPIQTALFELAETDAAAEVTRSIFRMAREVQESFSVYGEHGSFEWQQLERGQPVEYRVDREVRDEIGAGANGDRAASLGRRLGLPTATAADLIIDSRFPRVEATRVDPPAADDHLPQAIRSFKGPSEAEPHLVHEFVRSIVERRPSAVCARVAADSTAAGICAHASSLAGGTAVEVPAFS